MDTINTKKKIILIIFVLLLLVVFRIFYLQSNKVPEDPITETEEVINTNDTALDPEKGIVEVVEENSLTNKEEDAKFDLALSKGSEAFLLKNYDLAVKYYKEALDYKDSDLVYIRLYSVYVIQNNIDEARLALEKAIKINPIFTDYWITKLVFLDEATNISFLDLKTVYQDGLTKVDSRYKINLVTSFARIAENNKENTEAIALWEYAKTVYPQNSAIYQAEIDMLKASL